ncbi:hypothetical protein CBI30_07365 [Polynucleobacter aenigmaticus]|uniref:PilZ domain-containing protein n=1 Tax=Polynucleobacter aenigmaticus TaxID=1743164 RepID=A0A254Q8L5_9BURK|nr:PilZ domain-containing protein [Polynucleobacter aenigmaticus]OWS71257.1 hypothetical protein CBI30_07365 [Polynucleobacter aenigmaticus]
MVKMTPSEVAPKGDLVALRGEDVFSSPTGCEGIRRADARINGSLPVTVNGIAGMARDISASGIFFEIDECANNLGSLIQLSVQLDTPGGGINLLCEGKVVRIEKRDGKLCIAAKIISQTMQSL